MHPLYFEAVPLKDKKPNAGFWRNKVVLFNSKNGNVRTVTPGMAVDWEYFAADYTHWLKSITNKKLKSKLCTPSILKEVQK